MFIVESVLYCIVYSIKFKILRLLLIFYCEPTIFTGLDCVFLKERFFRKLLLKDLEEKDNINTAYISFNISH